MTDIYWCACGARVLDSFIGIYNDARGSHTRERCSPHAVTLGNTTEANYRPPPQTAYDAALIRFAREVLRKPWGVRSTAVDHGLAEWVRDGAKTGHSWQVKPGVLE